MSQPSSSSSSPFISRYTYDVFLSFRGEDTRYGFTGNLYSALSQRGIFTFIDDEALQKGQDLTPSLHKAIQESRMSIIVFSKNYASSTFCLNELVQILECYTKRNMWILPVFYDIDPSHVRHQKGSYQEALAIHESGRFKDNIDKVQKWRLALHEAANLSGLRFKIGGEYEFEFIKKIIEEISSKINRPPLHIADYPVGLKSRMEQIQRLMGGEVDNKVIMLGIHGMGGIGKSTLARAIYNLIAHQFEGSCFLADVREKSSTKHGLVQIQETMLSELVGERNIKLGDVYHGIPILQKRLCRKKVLVVLDDADKKEQLQAAAGGLDWFGPGSIIVITTRDKHLLDVHGVQKLYKVNELDYTEALELFRWNAFKNKEIDPNYTELIKPVLDYASGLPLALGAIASNLLGKTFDEWKSELEAYERIPNIDVQKILRVSYDSLNANEQEIFLDIACFLRGCSLTSATAVLEARGFYPKCGIGVLERKSLIKISRYEGNVIMHDLIQSMGKEIVRQQSPWPQKRSRLWFYEDIVSVLENSTQNDEIEAMMLNMPDDQEVQWNEKVFEKMKNLRMMLIVNANFRSSPKNLPNSLRVLVWWEYPGSSLPSNFHPKNLVILNLSHSYFQWDKPLQNSKVLRYLILKGCKNIKRIPDMSGFPNLTELCFCECTNLIEIHDSVGYLHNLKRFCAEECTKLKILPGGINLPSLEYFSLKNCSHLGMFPEILAPMHKLKFVDLEGTAIKNLLPHSMQNLEGLQSLSLSECKIHESNQISNIFQKLPQFFPNLTQLCLHNSNLTILPACTEECHSLKGLCVFNCKKLQEIRGLPRSTIHLSALNTLMGANSSTLNMLLRRAIDTSYTEIMFILPGQRIPEWFDHSSRGSSLHFWFRNELPSLTVCATFRVLGSIEASNNVEFRVFARINDTDLCVASVPFSYAPIFDITMDDHIFIFNFNHQNHLQDSDFERALKTNEWIRGNVSFVIKKHLCSLALIKWTEVRVNRAFSRMEDVQFTDPYPPNHTSDVGNEIVLLHEAPHNHIQQEQEQQSLAPLGSEIGEQPPLNYVSSPNDQDGAFVNRQAMEPREFICQCRDYSEANLKIDEVDAGLETKSQLSKVVALEDKVHQKLSRIKKMKKDLGDQLSAIKANISAIEADHSAIKAKISSIKAIIINQKGNKLR